jgi:Uri superfamily endonuclease
MPNTPPQLQCPDATGAYVVAVAIRTPVEVRCGRQAPVVLPRGRYLYCGSAYGPGGLRARLARHFRADKTVRWHIDQLTTRGDVLGAFAVPGGDECRLVRSLSFLPVPMQGFGASDCADCCSHLLRWPARVGHKTIMAALARGGGAPLWLRARFGSQ